MIPRLCPPCLAAALLVACGSPPDASIPEPDVPQAPPDPDAWDLESAQTWTATASETGLTLTSPDALPQLHLGSVIADLGGAPLAAPLAGAWDPVTSSYTGTATTGPITWSVTLSHVPGDPALPLAVTASFAEATTVRHLALELLLPSTDAAPPEILDRAHRWRPIDTEHVIDAWTPQHVRTPALALHAQALALTAAPTAAGTRLRLVLDDARAHPFRPNTECVAEHADGLPTDNRDAATRPAGAELTATAHLVLGDSADVQWLRFPAGYRSALVFTDHADQSDVAKMGALLYGTGRYGEQAGIADGERGLLGRGLSLTKSVFVEKKRFYARQVDDPDYEALLVSAIADGMEVCPHSITGVADDPARTAAGLDRLGELAPVTSWIDHQPTTNCEALTNSGWRDGDWKITDVLTDRGVRYAWNGFDIAPSDGVNLFDPAKTDAWTPTLYRHPDVGSLELFMSLWRAKDRPVFLGDYRPERLDRLARDRGLHFAHTYLDVHTDFEMLAGWTLLEPADGGFRLRDDADALFADLATRQADRHTWVSTVTAVGDHLHATRSVAWTWAPGRVRLVPADGPVLGLTLHADATLGAPLLDGTLLPDSQRVEEDGGTTFWFDCPTEGVWLSFEEAGTLRVPVVVEGP